MQVGEIARVRLIEIFSFVRDSDDRPSVLATLGCNLHLALCLLLQQDLDGVVGVDAAELGIVAQHFGSNLIGDAILHRRLVGTLGGG